MEILKTEELWSKKNCEEMLVKYMKKSFEEKKISDTEYNKFLLIDQDINYQHSHNAKISENFREIFTKRNTNYSITRGYGSQFSGLKLNGNILFGENVEMGTIFMVPKNQDTSKAKEYLELIELVLIGLKDKNKFQTMIGYLEEEISPTIKYKK